MAAPAGALQRAVLVAVPLALVVLIVVTPILVGREQPVTAIPLLHIEVFGEAPNETAMLYIRSALGVTRYTFLEIDVAGVEEFEGNGSHNEATDAPSLLLKFPIDEARKANVTAMAEEEAGRFWYNLTLQVVADVAGPILLVTPEGEETPRQFRATFTTSMRREAST